MTNPNDDRARALFDNACSQMMPGKSWEECDEWVRQMWRQVADGTYVEHPGLAAALAPRRRNPALSE